MNAYDAYLAGFEQFARWKMDDGSVVNDATCADEAGANDFTYKSGGGTLGTAASPIIGDTQAVTLTGGAHATKTAPTSALYPAIDRAVSYWIYFNSVAGVEYIVSVVEDSQNYWHQFRNGRILEHRCLIGNVAHSVKTTADAVSAGQWHFVVVDTAPISGARTIYVDGVDVTAASSASLASAVSSVAVLGARYDLIAPMAGRIADFAWTTSLTAGEVAELYQAATSELVPRYEVYRRDTMSGADTLVGMTADDIQTFTVRGLAADSVAYYWVRAVSGCGVRDIDPVANRLRQAALDGSADLIAPTPNAPYNLRLPLRAGGHVTARWAYIGRDAEADASQFFVYVATGEDDISYTTPTHTVSTVKRDNTQDLGTFADATVVKCAVRAATAADLAETNTVEATATADATAPAVPAALAVTAEAS